MRKLLKEISVIPGVTGSCIFDKNEGAVCTELGSDLPRNLTEQVGIHFVRLVQMGGMNNLAIKSAHFRFDRYAVVGLPLEKGAILLAICDSQANCSLVATTAAMLVQDMREEMERPLAAPASGGPVAVRAAGAEQGSKRVEADLQPRLKEIEEALALAIGPVAAMVMADYLNKWQAGGPATAERLPGLVDMLVSEIDDTVLAQEFKSHLKHLL